MGLFSVFQSNEIKKNKSYIKNLLEVAIADGQLDKSELNVIINIAAKFDITKNEVLLIKDNHPAIEFTPPSSYSAKVKLLEDLILVITADKIIEKDEISFCREIANKLDINTALVDDLLKAHHKS
jgi:uncharacterized tellurite resistance protein B-like protein